MKIAVTGFIEDKKVRAMSEQRFRTSPEFTDNYWSGSGTTGRNEPDNNRPLPWDTRVKLDNNFATEVWKVCDEIGNLLISKQEDYGPDNVNLAHGGPINGLLVRIGDKYQRLKNLFGTAKVPNHESIEDSFKDLANYAIIALMVERGAWPKS